MYFPRGLFIGRRCIGYDGMIGQSGDYLTGQATADELA
jgi:hypothetical protein